jgi:hypothetical protein
MTKVFNLLDEFGGHSIYGNDLVTNGTDIEPGLMVNLDSGGRAVSLSAGTGSKPFGFAYGDRTPMQYAPTTKTYGDAEALNVVTGHGYAAMSSDFFTSGSLPTEAAYRTLYAGASGKLALSGTYAVARLIDIKSWTAPTQGTGTSENVAIIQYDFQDLA